MKLTFSSSHCWTFQIYWHTEGSTLATASFRICNSPAGILSPSLALFVVMLLKAHLTSHSRMFGSGCVPIPSWLSRSLSPLLYSYSVYSCYLFLISPASVMFLSFLSFIVPIFAWNFPFVSKTILKRSLVFSFLLLSSIKRSLVFSFLLLSSISLHCSFKKALLSLLAILCYSAFNWIYLSLSPLLFTSLLSSAICKPSSDNPFSFLHFFLFGVILITAPYKCYEPLSIVLKTLCVPDLISWIYSSPLLYNHKGFDLG